MNKVKKIFTIILIFSSIYLLFRYNYLLNISVTKAVNLWLNKVFPTLFIMFILNDIIINSGIFNNIGKYINPLFNKLFKTDGNASLAFILSLFSGTPSAAFILREMIQNNQISINTANKLISFTYFSNPLFLYTILRLTFNNYITIKIILIHYLTNILIGLIYRNKENSQEINTTYKDSNNKILILLPKAINKSFNTLLMILGTITFYMIITNFITTIGNFNYLTQIIIKGLFEITQALNELNNLSVLSIIKELIALSIISFGGLSIHTQVLSIISDTKISYKNFFMGRLYHTILSTITYSFIYWLTR